MSGFSMISCNMNTAAPIFMILILLAFSPVSAQVSIPIVFEGRVGDYSKQAKILEIDNRIYKFPADVIVEDKNGRRLTFGQLVGGARVRVEGVSHFSGFTDQTVKYMKIIVIGK